MSDYEEDQFEKDEQHDNNNNNYPHSAGANEKKHKMKLSIDFLTLKDMRISANILIQYSLKLLQ